jgi:Na+:H+ antiporter, NhaA family
VKVLRSERVAAGFLLLAAIVGLVLANSAAAPMANAIEGAHLGFLSVGHWVKDGLLAVFFFIAAIELRHELRHGELDSPRKALVPGIAAVGGVIVPALLFLLLVRNGELSDGWPIPTATDIAFALGVLAIVGRGIPARFRALLLALAVIDDLIAILIIAVFFTAELSPVPLLLAVPAVGLFGLVSARVRAAWATPLLIALGLVTWLLVYLAGIHPTIAGVALGLVLADRVAGRTRAAIEPWSNVVILPLFALVAALVPIPTVSPSELSPAFWAVLVALPVGKVIGITAGALIAMRLMARSRPEQRLPLGDVLAIAALGGIGFTVSLLMNELAYADHPEVADQVTLGVLLASVLAAIVGAALTAMRSRHYRQLSGGRISPR